MPLVIATSAPNSAAFALGELRRAEPGLNVVDELDAGVQLIQTGDAARLADALVAHPPTFIRHLAPADITVPLAHERTDIEAIVAAVAATLTALPPRFLARPHAVQVRLSHRVQHPYTRYAVAEPLRALLDSHGPEDVRRPEIALSVYCGTQSAYAGIWPISHCLSDWPGGERRFAVTPDLISRAEFKLLEALEVFNLLLPPPGPALDLGAAPGGWTRLLTEQGFAVLAVDPAALDLRVAALPGVRHWRGRAEDYLFTQLRGASAPQPDRFAVIANDMRLDARDSSRLMVEAAPLLYDDGLGLMTLKLPHSHTERIYQQARSILSERYTVVGARQLFHDRSEVTVALRPYNMELLER